MVTTRQKTSSMAEKRALDDSSPPNQFTYRGQAIYQSRPIQDRSSTFVAIYSSSVVFLSSPKVLQQYAGFEDATHRILAWRRRTNQLGLGFGRASSSSSPDRSESPKNGRVRYETGSDEDGEKYAGRKVEKILEQEGVEGVVVVARWYGGVMIGPVRFKWIEDCAADAIAFSKGRASGAKKTKIDGDNHSDRDSRNGSEQHTDSDDEKQKQKLVRSLKGRDGRIEILRTLLSAKKEKVDKYQEESTIRSQTGDEVTPDAAPVNKMRAHMTPEEKEQTSQSRTPSQSRAMETRTNSEGESNTNTPMSTTEGNEGATQSSTPAAVVDSIANKPPTYEDIPLEKLKHLERARDSTVRWILMQLDAVEEKVKIQEEADYKKVKVKAQTIRRIEQEEEKKEDQRKIKELKEKEKEWKKDSGNEDSEKASD